jgi:hypothetical protein
MLLETRRSPVNVPEHRKLPACPTATRAHAASCVRGSGAWSDLCWHRLRPEFRFEPPPQPDAQRAHEECLVPDKHAALRRIQVDIVEVPSRTPSL